MAHDGRRATDGTVLPVADGGVVSPCGDVTRSATDTTQERRHAETRPDVRARGRHRPADHGGCGAGRGDASRGAAAGPDDSAAPPVPDSGPGRQARGPEGARRPARARGVVSRSAARPDAAVRATARQGAGVQRLARAQSGARRDEAAGRRQGRRLRRQLRRHRPVPAGRQLHGRQHRVDTRARRGLRGRPEGRLREHPATASREPEGRLSQDHSTAESGDQDDQVRRAGHRHRAGQPPDRLRAAVRPAGRLRAGRPDDHHDHRRGG